MSSKTAPETEPTLETVDGLEEEETQELSPLTMSPLPGQRRKARFQSPPVRNLTFETVLATMNQDMQSAIAAIPEEETVETALPKLNGKGDKVRDGNGYVVIEKRVVLKRDKVAKEWEAKIAKVEASIAAASNPVE